MNKDGSVGAPLSGRGLAESLEDSGELVVVIIIKALETIQADIFRKVTDIMITIMIYSRLESLLICILWMYQIHRDSVAWIYLLAL